MSQDPQSRAPRMEVSSALPLIPAGMWTQSGLFSPANVPDTVKLFAVSAISQLKEKAHQDTAGAKTVMTLLGDTAASTPECLERVWDSAAAGEITQAAASQLYEKAAQLVDEGNSTDALHVLAVLAGAGTQLWQAALGLAVIALQAKRLEIACDLAIVCLNAPERHPRVQSVMGICALEQGDKVAAQAYLAAAARIARSQPVFRDELQIAQRALLLMHLA